MFHPAGGVPLTSQIVATGLLLLLCDVITAVSRADVIQQALILPDASEIENSKQVKTLP